LLHGRGIKKNPPGGGSRSEHGNKEINTVFFAEPTTEKISNGILILMGAQY
jgi:hypothetical protein